MSSDSGTAAPEAPSVGQYPEGAEIETFKGSCNCGKFTFEFQHPSLHVKKPISCNCTFCTKTGGVNVVALESYFCLNGGPKSWDDIGKFVKKNKAFTQHFCPQCGCWMFWTGMGLVGVNIRMFDGIEVDKLSIDHFDGRNKL
ncbi:uncharacterized protein FOMMEDRAFT_165995 [Fomitiporia mediterranea MF3/22]|uniref:uncharacterized protein n=1 Tax=Fomitiporia mediterranea (strain MF3/22) TaxID=694068 RepID=UPI0004408DCD|nr:uncharacterized protein FOMMEDRAFT_165995 [Fomitiporia mediterranea MF3/22]EJD05619.1 hypothetical protein FOMMEDRAFT_165995 [Fomitiporia mediterranea MF3/22]